MNEKPDLLLDTCAMIFVSNDTPMSEEAAAAISEAAYDGRLYLSPMSAWEIGVAVAKGRLNLPIGPLEFFERFLERLQAKLSPVTPSILIASSNLPGTIHGDPMDRILMATARALDMVLVTRDAPILAYAKAGNVRALVC